MSHPLAQTGSFVGVDLGGTKILAGVFTPELKLVSRNKLSTKAHRGAEHVIERIARAVREAVDEAGLNLDQIKAAGIGAPGAVEPDLGRVIFAANLGWKNLPLKESLERRLGLPVFVENDANICTLGIYHAELQAKPRHMAGIYLGTGIGAGIIIDGRLYRGFNRTAGEIGHMILQVGGPRCGCGKSGCFEAMAGRQALFRKIQSAVQQGQETLLTEMLGPDLADMRSGDLRKAIRRGDSFVDRIVREAAEYTGIAVANIINILNPETVVLGGGLIDALENEMMGIISETARDYALPGTVGDIQILASKLGDDAGITGAAVLARQSAHGSQGSSPLN